jgi:prepilin-type N-terminal cleavage/methylation domain-containing protein
MIHKRSKLVFKPAFTLLELIFVIVIIGVLSKFGIELMGKAYENYIFTQINNRLQNQSGTAVEFVAKRLSYRIPDSVIGKINSSGDFDGVQELNTSKNYDVLEWVATDVDGWRGESRPYWSGIADLNASSNSFIITPETNNTAVNNFISLLSDSTTDILDSAIYFIGSNSDVQTGYGWDGTAVTGLGAAMHPITAASINRLDGNFSNVDLYEYYKLSWTANAIRIENDGKGNNTYDLIYHYNYQPWLGETYNDGNSSVIMEDVSTFQFIGVGNMIKVQVCVKSELTSGAHAICKEKTVF